MENCRNVHDIHATLRNNGGLGDALKIPAGGSRMPCTPETAVFRDVDGDGNLRVLNNLVMRGSDVFTFVQTEVPPLIEDTLRFSGVSKEEIERISNPRKNSAAYFSAMFLSRERAGSGGGCRGN